MFAAQYEFPPDKPISAECQELMQKIFVADPTRRISVADIVRHPWFTQGLPPGLDVDAFNSRPAQQAEVSFQLACSPKGCQLCLLLH